MTRFSAAWTWKCEPLSKVAARADDQPGAASDERTDACNPAGPSAAAPADAARERAKFLRFMVLLSISVQALPIPASGARRVQAHQRNDEIDREKRLQVVVRLTAAGLRQ